MFDILAIVASLDLLALLFLIGSLAFLWALWQVLKDDEDFGRAASWSDPSDRSSHEFTEESPTPSAGLTRPSEESEE